MCVVVEVKNYFGNKHVCNKPVCAMCLRYYA